MLCPHCQSSASLHKEGHTGDTVCYICGYRSLGSDANGRVNGEIIISSSTMNLYPVGELPTQKEMKTILKRLPSLRAATADYNTEIGLRDHTWQTPHERGS